MTGAVLPLAVRASLRQDAGDQTITLAFRLLKQLEVADVESVKGPGCVTGAGNLQRLLSYEKLPLIILMKRARTLSGPAPKPG